MTNFFNNFKKPYFCHFQAKHFFLKKSCIVTHNLHHSEIFKKTRDSILRDHSSYRRESNKRNFFYINSIVLNAHNTSTWIVIAVNAFLV